MSKPSDYTTTLSYAVTGIAAVFGMYNAIIFLFYSQKTTNAWTMLLCIWEYLRGFVYGAVLVELALVLMAVGYAIWEKEKTLKVGKFLYDINANMVKILKTVLRLLVFTDKVEQL